MFAERPTTLPVMARPWALAEQLAYYRAVAQEYEDHAIDAPGQGELLSAIDSFRLLPDVHHEDGGDTLIGEGSMLDVSPSSSCCRG